MSILRNRRNERRKSSNNCPLLKESPRVFDGISSIQGISDCFEHAISELCDTYDAESVDRADLKKMVQVMVEGAGIFMDHADVLWRVGDVAAEFFRKGFELFRFLQNDSNCRLAELALANMLCGILKHELNHQLLLRGDVMKCIFEFVHSKEFDMNDTDYGDCNLDQKEIHLSEQFYLAIQDFSKSVKNEIFSICIEESKHSELFLASSLYLWSSMSHRNLSEIAMQNEFCKSLCQNFLQISAHQIFSSGKEMLRASLLLRIFANIGSSNLRIRDDILISFPKILLISFEVLKYSAVQHLLFKRTSYLREIVYISLENIINLTNQSYIVSEILKDAFDESSKFKWLMEFLENSLASEDLEIKVYSLCLLANLFEYSPSISLYVVTNGGKLLDLINSLAYNNNQTDEQRMIALHSAMCIGFLLDGHYDLFKCMILRNCLHF
jgi:hypothetical protein